MPQDVSRPKPPPSIAAVCVYCGARHGRDAAFTEAARTLGAGLAGRGLSLVYGAGDVGLMGEVARSAMAGGGRALGVMPRRLMEMEVGKRDLTAFVLVDTMHERKKVMFANADAVVALPGGAGTLDEFFEVLTWRQLGMHAKPLILVNVEGFWDPLLALLDHVVAQGFADPSVRDVVTVAPDAEAALAIIDARNEQGA
ncbi:TIGR00730 family Rossman fold protein [Rubrimonas cliftonensis]|uniref:Cytokinin riboside 5'-monophosphate phosphoribohydrolase n=1 Tax=Rubrimonas cliftonensis TaxID=89524 RepID=A0A1H4DN88_9RHOB|nr:TIGR00730 family Rossman fold protein [Rubrimonas cliftonensis]SEA74231.1 hypothetical protein SAMN05444370_110144 [Rubrimonas cliftonensis]